MPAYQCRDCDTVFKSKSALQEHRESCTGVAGDGDTVYEDIKAYIGSIDLDLSRSSLHPRRVKRMFTLRNAGIAFGVLMMATLFLGTASFMTQTAPTRSGGGPTGAVTATSNPALGYGVRSAQDVPRLSGDEQPQPVSTQPLSTEQQLWAVTQGGPGGKPGIVIYHNCDTACPGLVENLTAFAEQPQYAGWVYVAPNPEIGSRVAVTGFQRIQRYDSVQPAEFHTTICSVYRQLRVLGPASCATG